jgi:hypothetical protein
LWNNQLIVEKIYFDEIVSKDKKDVIIDNILTKLFDSKNNYALNNVSFRKLYKDFSAYDTSCTKSWSEIWNDLKHIVCTI